MQAVSAEWRARMASPVVRPVWDVTSWLGGEQLATIPVVGGAVTTDVGQQVSSTVTLSVPALREWIPGSPSHPLGNAGQRLVVRRGLAGPTGEVVDMVTVGIFRVWSAKPDGDKITVRGDGLAKVLELAAWTEDGVLSGSALTQLRALVDGMLPIEVDPGVVDRVASARPYEVGGSRVDLLDEIVTALAAEWLIDDASGVLVVRPVSVSTVPVLTVHDGPGGTVRDVVSAADSDRLPNCVVASSAPTDGTTKISASAALVSGPWRWGGPYGRVPAFFASPLLSTRAQCAAAARTRLASLRVRVATLKVTMLTDVALEDRDVIRVVSDRLETDVVARVIGRTVPIVGRDEPGDVTVSCLSGVALGEPVTP